MAYDNVAEPFCSMVFNNLPSRDEQLTIYNTFAHDYFFTFLRADCTVNTKLGRKTLSEDMGVISPCWSDVITIHSHLSGVP